VGGAWGSPGPPKFYRLQFGGARAPPKFYQMLSERQFEHNKIKEIIGEQYKTANQTLRILKNSLKVLLKYQNFLNFSKYFYILSLGTLRFLTN
jgi:hypothetical protein